MGGWAAGELMRGAGAVARLLSGPRRCGVLSSLIPPNTTTAEGLVVPSHCCSEHHRAYTTRTPTSHSRACAICDRASCLRRGVGAPWLVAAALVPVDLPASE